MYYIYKKKKAVRDDIADHHEEKEMEDKEQGQASMVTGEALENDSYIQPTVLRPIHKDGSITQQQAMEFIEFSWFVAKLNPLLYLPP